MPDKTNGNKELSDELSYHSIATILDSLDALVYVADMDTYELLYINKYGRDIFGDIQGKICWKSLQEEQDEPCSFCTNDQLLDDNGKPTGVYVWEFQNTIDKRWYQCRDQAITWVDGRLVRMEIATDITERKLAEEELKIAKHLADELALKDELTGLNNRRAFFDQGDHVFKQAIRFEHPISIIMMDIDYFKNINDSYGHSAGDKVLETIAAVIKDIIREVDIVGRMGGEEFAFVLTETDADEAINLAERLKLEIKKTAIEYKGQTIQVTASLGICSCPVKNETLETLLTKADDALYIAKRNGRDQVKAYN